MIKKQVSKFIKCLDLDTRESPDEIKRVLRWKFLEFCDDNGVNNSIKTYREYRSVVISIYGFDLLLNRPKKEYKRLETTIELFWINYLK